MSVRDQGGAGRPVFRFAPSPNGHLHLGHALSALMNRDLAAAVDGILLLRLEDIDRERCREVYVQSILEDLDWLGLAWTGAPRRQSEHFGLYREALDRLAARALVYPCFCTRGAVLAAATASAAAAGLPERPVDPDGAPLYPGTCRRLSAEERARRLGEGRPAGLRLDMAAALAALPGPLAWEELDDGREPRKVAADPAVWGDALLARKDIPTSYHLSVVVDDFAQGVTDVVRGRDLFQATALHRLLQTVLGLSKVALIGQRNLASFSSQEKQDGVDESTPSCFGEPRYRHHRLVLDADGHKLSKSRGAPALRDLRMRGATPAEIRRIVGLSEPGRR